MNFIGRQFICFSQCTRLTDGQTDGQSSMANIALGTAVAQ